MNVVSNYIHGCSVGELRKKFETCEASSPNDRNVSYSIGLKSSLHHEPVRKLDKRIKPLPPLPSDSLISQHNVSYNEIKLFVINFLHPYLSRECRPENEPKNRLSMMEQLFKSLSKEKKNFDELTVEKIALECYLLEAASGVYRFIYEDVLEQFETDAEFDFYIYNRLINALRPALKKDFPQRFITEGQL